MDEIPRYVMATSNTVVMDGPTHQTAVAQWLCAEGWRVYVCSEPRICVPELPYQHIFTQLGSGNENVWRHTMHLQCLNLRRPGNEPRGFDVIVFDATVNDRPRYSHCHVLFDLQKDRGPEYTLMPFSTGSTDRVIDFPALRAEIVAHVLGNGYYCGDCKYCDGVKSFSDFAALHHRATYLVVQQGWGNENVWRKQVATKLHGEIYDNHSSQEWIVCIRPSLEVMQDASVTHTSAWIGFVKKV